MEHTPIPWETRIAENTGHVAIYPVGSKYRVADCYLDPLTHDGTLRGNAAYIVQCVNHHEELVKALRFLADAAETEPGMTIYKAHIDNARAILQRIEKGE